MKIILSGDTNIFSVVNNVPLFVVMFMLLEGELQSALI